MYGNTRISLHSYLYLKLAKMPCFSFYLLCFLFHKIGEQEGRIGFAQRQGREGGMGGVVENVVQTMYTHVSKCKNNTC
jgi:hypothetical protein